MECPICFESGSGEVWCTLPCGHVFCLRCLVQVRRDDQSRARCAVCRHDVTEAMPETLGSTPFPITVRIRADSGRDGEQAGDDTFEDLIRRFRLVSAELARAVP
jgi:hypothetical protein